MGEVVKPLPAVYAAIEAVMTDVGKEGIAKGRNNPQQNYKFRGIDDVYNALAPILARHHLIMVPRVVSREKTEQPTKSGGVLFYVVVQVEFDIICATDGSKLVASTWGEAMDSGDKATNKAMSAAYKYMAMQTFCIPTEGDNDADASTPDEVRPNAGSSQSPPARTQQATGAASTPRAAPVQTMSKGDARADYMDLQEGIRNSASVRDLQDWGKMNAKRVELLPPDWKTDLRKRYQEMLDGLRYIEKQALAANEEDAA